MKITEDFKKMIQERFDYTDEELKEFLDSPRNHFVLEKTLDFANKTIVIEVVESHGCNSQHKVGDKFIFDGGGNLLTKLNPKRICLFALAPIEKLAFAAIELIYAGVNPNEMQFKRTNCFDVGLKCGGFGRIVMEISVQDRNKRKK